MAKRVKLFESGNEMYLLATSFLVFFVFFRLLHYLFGM